MVFGPNKLGIVMVVLCFHNKVYNNTLGRPSRILKCLGFFFFKNLLSGCKETTIKFLLLLFS
jgi:hypothetical protein